MVEKKIRREKWLFKGLSCALSCVRRWRLTGVLERLWWCWGPLSCAAGSLLATVACLPVIKHGTTWPSPHATVRGLPTGPLADSDPQQLEQVLCSSWDGRPFDHNRHEPKIGVCAPFFEGVLDPHLTIHQRYVRWACTVVFPWIFCE